MWEDPVTFLFAPLPPLLPCQQNRWYVLAAEQGYARAQFTLGTCFEVGRGVCRSYPNSVRWYQEAADQGFAAAQVLSLTVLWVLV